MAKIKKTRKEKKLADQRKKIIVTTAQQIAPDKEEAMLTIKPVKVEQNISTKKTLPVNTISTSGYNYLSQDLIKTAILTSSIVIVELVIKQFAKI